MSALQGLESEKVFFYFEELSKYPHGSGDTGALADYLCAFADAHGLKHLKDDRGNVIICAPGTGGLQEAPAVILQGHMDMVAVKESSSKFDFTKDPLELFVEGDEIGAAGTSLGGDDGIGVACMLAVLDDADAVHPPLECVFTTDEEVGMLGAHALDFSALKGKRMINLDSELEGIFTCGCAGGARVDSILPLKRNRIRGLPVLVAIDGLKGGHSGMAIGDGLASANKLMGRFLYELEEKVIYSLEKVAGGDKDNAISISAKAYLVVDEEDFAAIESFAREFEKAVRAEYLDADDGITMHVSKGDVHRISVISPDDQEKLIFLLLHAPYGVRRMSTSVKGAVQTSSNPGIVRTTDTEFVCGNLVRSSEESAKQALLEEISSLARAMGAQVHVSESYPGWAWRKNSPLRDQMAALYESMFSKAPVLDVTHGGLECGLFCDGIKGLDVVSIGPDIRDIHSFHERLSISSSRRLYEFLLKLLAELR